MTPLPLSDVAVAFELLTVIVMALEDTMVSTIGVSDGVMMPSVPVERNVEFAPEMVRVTAVEDTITSSLMLALRDGDALGEMTPSVPVEKKVENASLTVTLPSPPGVGRGVGVTMPSVPVEP